MHNMYFFYIFYFLKTSLSYNVNLKLFGSCNFQITQFSISYQLDDLSQEVIHQNKDLGLWTFHDSKYIFAMARPSIAVNPPCTLHVIIGVNNFENVLLQKFMQWNPYTQATSSHSTYLIIFHGDFVGNNAREIFRYGRIRVFFTAVDFQNQSSPWYFFCPYCFVGIDIASNKKLKSISTIDLKDNWRRIAIKTNMILDPGR